MFLQKINHLLYFHLFHKIISRGEFMTQWIAVCVENAPYAIYSFYCYLF